MSEKVKKGDFVEIEYEGRLKEPDVVFDTTDEAQAKKEGVHSAGMNYGPITICVGETQLLKGLDDNLEDKEIGKEHIIELGPEHAFGKRSAKMMKLVPASTFKKHQIRPVTGLQINIDGALGTIRTVTGGRVIVDFNHPFSGKDVIYKVKINRKIDDRKAQAKAFLNLAANVKSEAVTVEEKEGKTTITIDGNVHPELLKHIKQKLGKVIPYYKDAELTIKGR